MPFKEMKGIEGVVEFKLALNSFLYPLQILLLLLFPRNERKENEIERRQQWLRYIREDQKEREVILDPHRSKSKEERNDREATIDPTWNRIV